MELVAKRQKCGIQDESLSESLPLFNWPVSVLLGGEGTLKKSLDSGQRRL